MFKLIDVFWAYILIAILILVGRLIRQRLGILRSLYIPSSIVAGILALLLGKGALGAIVKSVNPESPLVQGIFNENVQAVWSQSPGIFINIVFATLFLGQYVPTLREFWRKAAPQVALGQSLAWGQYVVGLILAITILTPVFGLPPIAACLIEVAFEGGHGTSAGMAATFTELGFTAGPDLSLALATVGLVSGVVSGTILIHWGRRTGRIKVSSEPLYRVEDTENQHPEEEPSITIARKHLVRDLLIDPLSLNFGFVGLAIAFGWLILEALRFIESITWGRGGVELITYVPLFPIALIGGMIVQYILMRTRRTYLISRPLMENIGGLALDITIVTALASISLSVLGDNLAPFLILSVAGIAWNVCAFVFLGPHLLPFYWFERGLGDMGQSMGVTSTGLLLLRMVDPDNRSGAFESFAYKQLLFEPIVGGGLFTAAAPLLIYNFGPIPILLLTSFILAFWLIFGFYNCKQIRKQSA
ncbi:MULTISPECIES: sodium/glutamate symporter [Cyanophyceae]|uniref:sodium/glutamate symporter n=1 Tax=Cyanophyceae TaxID=3028117 RepID=UPI00232C0136|nr:MULTISPECIES: sodium/glutamate symporter [Cyanophyceae]MDB9357533.1 sodium/glutamate symporter [Nodularia spumigena CS-587/03]MDB9321216.1 sodium/glutamate symporter [Nodularia spumigena CS-591/07A]MDB9332712.1 sodium/glutamate symporter [Nodularia spumigena CS-591/04]MDB9340489.1 sodium/glutamate symporter [Nodularia spumigena CS-589/07]MDB9346148.1 sodium/glutamate symporter [Nodularia spumigena CS-588/06]